MQPEMDQQVMDRRHAGPAATAGTVAAGVSPTAHYVRLGLVLAAGLACFALLRGAMVPESFGRDGHYRATAVDEIVARDPRYLGASTCVECHEKRARDHAAGRHAGVPCETCHGPARGHLTMAASRVRMTVPASSDLCIWCHVRVVGRPAGLPQIDLARHREDKGFGSEETCMDCHNAHVPQE